MQYNVHVCAVVRIKINRVEADNMCQAIERAEDEANLASLFPHHIVDGGRLETEYAEDVTSYLVDVVGDEEYSRTTLFDANRQVSMKSPET